MKFHVAAIAVLSLGAMASATFTIADFTTGSGVRTDGGCGAGGCNAGLVESWREISDTVRSVGKSKASLVKQQTQVYQRAVFFSKLNPQPNGAGFAGMSFNPKDPFDLSGYNAIRISGLAAGNAPVLKVGLRDAQLDIDGDSGDFEGLITVNLDAETPEDYTILISDLVYVRRGVRFPDFRAIDLTQIIEFGIQSFAGVFEDAITQKGATAFEIDTITAVTV